MSDFIPKDPVHRQWIYDQVVLTLINDSRWYNRVKTFDAQFNFERFRRESSIARRDILPHDLGVKLNSSDIHFLNLSLFEYRLDRPLYADDFESQNTHVPADYRAALTEYIALTNYKPAIREEPTMNPNALSPAFETKHYLYGVDVSRMTADQLIQSIKQVEGEIGELKAVKTKSMHLNARVAELESMLAKIVEQLDTK